MELGLANMLLCAMTDWAIEKLTGTKFQGMQSMPPLQISIADVLVLP